MSIREQLLKKEQESHKLNEAIESKARAMLNQTYNLGIVNNSNANITTIEDIKINHSALKLKLNGYSLNEDKLQTINNGLVEIQNNSKIPERKGSATKQSSPSTITNTLSIENNNNFHKKTRSSPGLNIQENGFTKIEKAKNKILENELSTLQGDHNKLLAELECMKTNENAIVSHIKKCKKENVSLRQTLNNKEKKLEEQTQRIRDLINIKNSIEKDLNQALLEQKTNKSNKSHYEVLLQTATDNVKVLQVQVNTLMSDNMELRADTKKKVTSLESQIKQLNKTNAQLLNGINQQINLIDNLKSQRDLYYLLQSENIIEGEFNQLLELNPYKN